MYIYIYRERERIIIIILIYIYICIYIYIYVFGEAGVSLRDHVAKPSFRRRRAFFPGLGRTAAAGRAAPNLPANIMDFRGFYSTLILILRCGIPRPIGNFPECLSQAILVGIMLVGRLGAITFLRSDLLKLDRYVARYRKSKRGPCAIILRYNAALSSCIFIAPPT